MAKGLEAAVPTRFWVSNDRPRVHPQRPHLKHESGIQMNPCFPRLPPADCKPLPLHTRPRLFLYVPATRKCFPALHEHAAPGSVLVGNALLAGLCFPFPGPLPQREEKT